MHVRSDRDCDVEKGLTMILVRFSTYYIQNSSRIMKSNKFVPATTPSTSSTWTFTLARLRTYLQNFSTINHIEDGLQ